MQFLNKGKDVSMPASGRCMMKLLKRILKEQAGQALPMALILLVLGGLIIVPMLSLMTTNLNANRVVETKTEGIYAADAGIQDALWKLGDGVDPFTGGDSYELEEDGTPAIINGMTVTIEKVKLTEKLYTIKATSRLDGEVKAVIVAQAIAGSKDYSWLFKQAITSTGSITTKKSDVIYGGVLCGGEFDDNADIRSGTVTENADVTFPSAEDLMDFYFNEVKDLTPYPSSVYNIPSGATEANPNMIPSIYRAGSLTVGGSGYGKLSGTIYLTGDFNTSPGITIDLNSQTIFTEGSINFQPGCTIYGPGCLIAIQNVNYQPNLGTGNKLIGIAGDPDTESNVYATAGCALSKFQATATGKLNSIHVKCYIADPEAPPAHVKVAVYDDDGAGGGPGTLLGAADYADNITVISSWNPINMPDVQITDNQYYWLAVISDYPCISIHNVNGTLNLFQANGFINYKFPNPFSTGFGPPTPSTTQFMMRGFTNSQEFIFLMAINGNVNLQPGQSFYGSIAGNTNVNLQPNTTINLVGYEEDTLHFPGVSGSGTGPGSGGNSPPILMYKIE
jgi:hypothetical protein